MINNPVENHSIMVMQILGQRVGSWFKVIFNRLGKGRQAANRLIGLIKYLKSQDFSLDRLTGKSLGTFANRHSAHALIILLHPGRKILMVLKIFSTKIAWFPFLFQLDSRNGPLGPIRSIVCEA
jgi:hypothetical protein